VKIYSLSLNKLYRQSLAIFRSRNGSTRKEKGKERKLVREREEREKAGERERERRERISSRMFHQ
jgi:hypothetical protein